MECKFCNNILKNLNSLNYHIKNNKKCLEIQNQISDNVDSSLTICKFCDKSFTKINNHLNICKKKHSSEKNVLNEEIEELKKENQELKKENQELKKEILILKAENNIYKKDHETIYDIAKQPKTTNNNINLSIYDDNIITQRFSMALSNVKPSDFYDGQQSIGRIVAPCLQNEDGSKLMYCSDYSRSIFVKKDKHGNINKDIKCRNLADLIEPIALSKADELIKEDLLKRSKSYLMKNLIERINKRNKDIEMLEQTIIGFDKKSNDWMYYNNMILSKKHENEKDEDEIFNMKNDGILIEDNLNTYDPKLIDAVDDIKEMKKDTTKFSKTLSEFV